MTAPAKLQPSRPQPYARASKDPVHLPLHRRLLFPYEAHDSPLPVLIEGKGKDVEVINERLYHLIALALRAYVSSWYTRISPRDRTLLPSINTSILTPLLQPILTNLYNDTSSLLTFLLIDLPTILHLHVITCRDSRHQASLEYGTLGDNYHARLPLLSVEKQDEIWQLSPLYLTSLADGVLRNGLPVEEYGSTVERLMARELLGRTVLGGVGRRLSEPWFWYGLLLKLLGESGPGSRPDKAARLRSKGANFATRASEWLTKTWSLLLVTWASTISTFTLLAAAPTPRSEHKQCAKPWILLLRALASGDSASITTRLIFGSVDCVATVASPVLDRVLPHIMETRVLTAGLSLRLIDLLERTLFPLDGYPAPTPPDPTPEEAEQMRRRLVERLAELIPKQLRQSVLPDTPASLLAPIASSECNAHLVGLLLDSVVAAVLPELVIKGG